MDDLDTPSDYRRLMEQMGAALTPLEAECMAILEEAGVNQNVVLHGKKVASVSVILAEHLNSAGCRLDLALVSAGALLHDVAKGKADHARRGAELIASLGYPETAEIIGSHMDISAAVEGPVDEAQVVYLADKLVQEDRVVSLTDRFGRALARCKDAAVCEKVLKRLSAAERIQGKIESMTRIPVSNMIG
jgi:putative nucleotidyltransferase with HDIG domain